jgi:hypothetical protein
MVQRLSQTRLSNRQAGNAMIYVLIIIALFAALSFVLSRQGSNSESSTLSTQQTEIYSTQILQTAMQIKQAVDSVLYSGSGTTLDTLDFTLPSDPGFDNAPTVHKVFHPDGGGVTMPLLPADATTPAANPAPGWYLGRFNNVEWTETAATDVILTAYHIAQPICQRIDQKLTGSTTIPVSTTTLKNMLIPASFFSGSNSDLTAAACSGCNGQPSMCVQDTDGSYSFYSVIEQR